MFPNVPVGLCNSFATLCVGVHPSDASVGLSNLSALLTRSSAPLAGRSSRGVRTIARAPVHAGLSPRVHANLHASRPNTAQHQCDQFHCF